MTYIRCIYWPDDLSQDVNINIVVLAFSEVHTLFMLWSHLIRYAKLRVAHAPGILGTFSPPPKFSDPDMHHGTCVTHVSWCMPGSLTSGFLWSRWRGKRSRHSRRMRNPQFCVSDKRPMESSYDYGDETLCIPPLIAMYDIFQMDK